MSNIEETFNHIQTHVFYENEINRTHHINPDDMMFSLSIIDMKTQQYVDYDDALKRIIKIEATQYTKQIDATTSKITETDDNAVPARMCNNEDWASFEKERIPSEMKPICFDGIDQFQIS